MELTLINIAKDLRKSVRTIQRLAQCGSLPVITKPTKNGFVYVVPLQAYIEWKNQRLVQNKLNNYLSDLDFLKQQETGWLDWCKNGALTGKPLSERTIELYKYCLGYYFSHIQRRYTKSLLISRELLRHVFSNIAPKSFSLKLNIHSALKSFVNYLVVKKIVDGGLLSELRQVRPRRAYPPKRLHCTLEQFNTLLTEASKWHSGQSMYDVVLNKAIIAIIGFAGLRVTEVCNLRLQDVDLVGKRLFVFWGKNKKNRYVGICSQLYGALNEYLDVRPKTELENLFATHSIVSSKPVSFTRFTLLQKIKRLSKRVGINITAHGLRRTFATVAANAGKPINIISLALGHSDLKTTQGYLMTTQDEVVREMQGW